MNSIDSKEELLFAKTIAGIYSNYKQVHNAPSLFAHINLYFIPIPWEIMKGPGFYSEQSYNHTPWSPYRQALHKLESREKTFILTNYKVIDQEKIAGAGFNIDIFNAIKEVKKSSRLGCSMHFTKTENNTYQGEVEPGCKCLISHNGKTTYLISSVEVSEVKWISHDIGINIKDNKKAWGSNNGPIVFNKINKMEDRINKAWLHGKHR